MSQAEKILNYLQSGGALTSMDALRIFGTFRLGARIYELRQQGYKIDEKTIKQNNKHFAMYYISDAEKREEAIRHGYEGEELRMAKLAEAL